MKTALAIVAALLVGLVVGSFRIQSELRAARDEIKSLQQQLRARPRRTEGLRDITSFLRVPVTSTPPAESVVPAPVSEPTGTNDVASPAPAPRAPRTENFEQQIQAAVELWKTRSELARSTFLGNLNASPVQTQMFDQTIAGMNEQLGEKIKRWAEYLKDQPTPTAETSLRMMNDLGGTLVSAYDELDRVLEPNWRTKAGSEFQLFDFINPEVALPLAAAPEVFRRRQRR